MSREAESLIGRWVTFVQEHWSHFRTIAAKNYGPYGRGAFVVDISKDPHLIDDSASMSYLTVDRAKDILGDLALVTFRSRISTYNPERQILFYFWDTENETATPRELSESPNGAPMIDTDAVWCNQERSCPKCATTFTSIRDHGQCPNCAHHFMASAVTTNDSSPRSDAEVPPIVEVIIDTSSAKDIESLIDLVYEKQIVREEDSLSRHEQMIVDVVELKAEVENGGFQQFFSNPSGDRIHATIAALECISADQSLAILKKACSLFADSQPSSDGEERFDQMEALKDQGDQQWDELDTEFYNVDEDLNQLLWDYWKKSDP